MENDVTLSGRKGVSASTKGEKANASELSLDPPIGDLFSTVRRDWHGVRLKEDSFEFFNGDGAPVIKPS